MGCGSCRAARARCDSRCGPAARAEADHASARAGSAGMPRRSGSRGCRCRLGALRPDYPIIKECLRELWTSYVPLSDRITEDAFAAAIAWPCKPVTRSIALTQPIGDGSRAYG